MVNRQNRARIAFLYRKCGPIIYSRCRHMLRDDALAEDATQDIFLKVMRHLDRAGDDTLLMPWIHRITTNHCLSLVRNRRLQAQPVKDLPELAGQNPEAEWADHHVTIQLVERAPEGLRRAAALYFVEGLRQEEIARELRISRRTVISRLNGFVSRSMRFVSRPPLAGLCSCLPPTA